MSDNFDLNDYNVSDAITDWMGDNFADKVQDLDLVVRARPPPPPPLGKIYGKWARVQ